MYYERINFSCKFNRLNIDEGFNVIMYKKKYWMLKSLIIVLKVYVI